jgi:glycosyltransferase involved in cell wall biosynthesis
MDLLDLSELVLVKPFPVCPELVVDYLNAADVLVQTSFAEGSPNVIKEAMACNCPIVATPVGDVQEIIGDTEGCYLCSFDPIDLKYKIEKVLRAGKRTSGRDRILRIGLDMETITNRLLNLYNEVVTDGNKI